MEGLTLKQVDELVNLMYERGLTSPEAKAFRQWVREEITEMLAVNGISAEIVTVFTDVEDKEG